MTLLSDTGTNGQDVTATLLDGYPAVQDGEWLYLVVPRSMHVIRVPASQTMSAPWRPVLREYPSIANYRLYRSPGKPWGVTVVVSHQCNLSCVYCFSEVGHSTASLSADRMLAIIDYTLDHRPDGPRRPFVVNFFGGEPTLNMAEIETVVRHTEEACAAVGAAHTFKMVTNGTAPRPALKFLAEHRFQLVVSMDAAPERQSRQRIYGRRSSPSQTVDAIKYLLDLGLPLRVRSTVTGETVEYMDETVEFFASLGVRFIHFEPVGPSGDSTPGRVSRYSTPTAEAYATNLLRAMNTANGLNVGVFGYAFEHLLSGLPESYCEPMSGEGSYNVLNATGELIMCPEMQDSSRNDEYGQNVGKVRDRHTVFVDITRKKEVGDLAMPLQAQSCQSCYARDICKSGCPSRNVQATGSLTKLDPYSCAVAKKVCADILRRVAHETFAGVEGTPDPVLRPLSLPPELCSPPLIRNALGVLQRAKIVFALTGERLPPQVDGEIARLTRLAGV